MPWGGGKIAPGVGIDMKVLAEAWPGGGALSTVQDLALSLSMARGVDEILAVVRQRVRPLLAADGVTFVLRDGNLCHYAEEDAIAPLWKGQRFPMETCISGWTMFNRDVAVIEDIYADDRIPHDAYRPTFVRSLVMVPVRTEDPVAAIGAYWARPYKPTADEVKTLQNIANCAAVAMTNVALFNSLQAARDEALWAKDEALQAKEEAVRAKDAVIMAMAALAETRDNDTASHVHRTQHYVRVLAEASLARGLFAEELNESLIGLLYKSAPLHDIGKVGIPDRILLKPGKLDEEEVVIMRTHAELGRQAIANAERHLGTCSPFFRVAQEIAHTHHEKWDGSGYPRGLAGSDIPISGRLMAVADVYDALVSERVYKAALPHEKAVEIIVSERGKHFDPDLVDVFVAVAPDFERIHWQFADADHNKSAAES